MGRSVVSWFVFFSICPGKAVGDYEESAAFLWWADLFIRC